MYIPGGYYLKARKIQESDIAHAPPHVREIWDWLIHNALHDDYGKLKRGQLRTTYQDILDGLSWYVGYRKMRYKKHNCEMAMKWLTKAGMITTAKTTRGMIVTVCNYDVYQNPKNYESHTNVDTKATMKLQGTDTIYKNDNNVNNEDSGIRWKLRNGEYYNIPKSKMPVLEERYPLVNVLRELADGATWSESQPEYKLKTIDDVHSQIANWLKTATDKARQNPEKPIQYKR